MNGQAGGSQAMEPAGKMAFASNQGIITDQLAAQELYDFFFSIIILVDTTFKLNYITKLKKLFDYY